MVSSLQIISNESHTKNEFETSLRALPSSWYERVHSWGGMEEKRLKEAIELVLQAGVSSPSQLLQLLQATHLQPEVRLAGFVVTGHLRPQEASGMLVQTLSDQGEVIQVATCEAIGLLGKRRLIWPLLGVLKDPASSDKLAEEAVRAIGRLGSRAATRPLLQILQSGSNPARRRLAARGLEIALSEGRLRDERVVEPLLAVLNSCNEALEVRCAVAAALDGVKAGGEKVAAPLLRLMQDKANPLELRREAARSLGGTRAEEAVLPLIERLADPDEDSDLRHRAGWALVMVGSQQAVAPLIELMEQQSQAKTEDPRLRAAVLNTLGWLYHPAAVVPLLQRLEDLLEAVEVRAQAAHSLGMIGDSRALEPLLKALEAEAPEIRYSAAYGLGQLGDARAIPALEWVAANDDGVVASYGEYGKIRVEAAEAIETIRSGGG
jgi:HEAT repeat protein